MFLRVESHKLLTLQCYIFYFFTVHPIQQKTKVIELLDWYERDTAIPIIVRVKHFNYGLMPDSTIYVRNHIYSLSFFPLAFISNSIIHHTI